MDFSLDIISKIFENMNLKSICLFMQTSKKYWNAARFIEFRKDFIVANNKKEFSGAKIPHAIVKRKRTQLMRYLISFN